MPSPRQAPSMPERSLSSSPTSIGQGQTESPRQESPRLEAVRYSTAHAPFLLFSPTLSASLADRHSQTSRFLVVGGGCYDYVARVVARRSTRPDRQPGVRWQSG
eukprot:465806-Rhodomonas_salina.3